jgi:hypothetical protein
MPALLADSLLALAASIDGDGGHAVCRTLSSILRDSAPFDAGEVVFRQADGLHRVPFNGGERPVAGDDLVYQVLTNGAPLRLDDARDLEPFAETRARMAEGGLKSALVLPLGTMLHGQAPHHAATPNGVLVLARRHGWAFVGVSLHFLGPLAAMAGLALDRSLALTALGHPAALDAGADPLRSAALRREGASLIAELQTLRTASAASGREVGALRSSLAAVRDELADSRAATIAAQSALDQAVGRCHELQARLDRGELPRREDSGGESRSREPAAAPASDGEESPPAQADETQAPEPQIAEPQVVAPAPGLVSSASAPPAVPSRRARRRRRGAFEPPGGPGTA